MLNLTNDGVVIKPVVPGSQFSLPNGDVVSPAYAGWSNGEYELVEAPVDPVPPPEPYDPRAYMTLSFAQLLIGLVTEQWITEAEGEAWLAGTLPGTVLLVIDGLPAEQRFPAKARALRPSEVLRNDPLVAAMGVAAGKTEAEIDTFFQTYAGV